MKSRISVSKLGANGRITIPKRIRDVLGLQAGDRVRFVERKGEIILEPINPSLRDYKGSLDPRERPEDFDKARGEAKRRLADKDDSD